MVCPRCIMTVEQLLKNHGFEPVHVRLGEADVKSKIAGNELEALRQSLEKVGFELLDDQKKQQIEKMKNLLIQKVQEGNLEEHFSLSAFLTQHIFKDYSYLSKLFSEVEGVTIEQFFILQKIEKVKEWLAYNEMTLNDIAWRLGYSSVQHLSAQFKKVTGLTPSHFKKIGWAQRKSIDGVK
jgi:AraC family transcriptional regulator